LQGKPIEILIQEQLSKSLDEWQSRANQPDEKENEMLTITYRNLANGQLKTISMDRPHGSNSDDLAWTVGLRTVCRLTGWFSVDVVPQVIEVRA
jgi:hypothetical protein